MKKKLLTALLVGAMALNITACGGSSDAAAPADNDQQTTTTDTAADDAADTEEDAVDVEDAAEADFSLKIRIYQQTQQRKKDFPFLM